jgi:hypothetical protein
MQIVDALRRAFQTQVVVILPVSAYIATSQLFVVIKVHKHMPWNPGQSGNPNGRLGAGAKCKCFARKLHHVNFKHKHLMLLPPGGSVPLLLPHLMLSPDSV